jgi:hypothetical protein
MKTIVTIIMLCGVLGGYAQTTPRYAASTKTWTFGEQTWSDAIRIPECNKSSFADSNTDPQCRSYTQDGKTWYYYNWPYVNKHAARLCPSPWRVPTATDFETLSGYTDVSALSDAWGYGGITNSTSVYGTGSAIRYWSSQEFSSFTNGAYYLHSYTDGSVGLLYDGLKRYGFQVRCVK